MKTIFSALIFVSTVVNAHFHINFPATRGPFVEDDEPNFCDGFTNVTSNRTDFPLSGGFVTMVSEHPSWTAAFLISTAPNPNTFDDFQQVNAFFKDTGEGTFCLPLNFATSNATGLQSGQNATIQMVFDGGDGELFQCADVTLTDSDSSLQNVQCSNSTTSGASTAVSFDVKLLGLLSAGSLIPLVL